MADTLRYRDIARQSLISTDVVDDGSAGRLRQLASTFKSFETTVAGLGADVAAARGAREGAAAGATGDPKLKSDLRAVTSKYAAAYNNSATRSYLVRAEADLEDTAARLEASAGTNAEAFAMSFDKVAQKTLGAAPAALREPLNEMFVQRRAAATARIGRAAVLEQNKLARIDTAEGVSRAVDRIARLRASDDPADFAAAEEEDVKLSLLIDGAVADNTISEAEGAAAQINAQRAVTRQTVAARFQRELDNPYGNPLAFIERLRRANAESEALPPEEEQKLQDELLGELRERNALASMAQQQTQLARLQRYEDGNKAATTELLRGTLTQRRLLQMVEDDEIDADKARVLANELTSGTLTAKSDPQVLMDMEINLLSNTEGDILVQPGLSPADRTRLILKRREEETGWRGSVPGREAVDRIDRALGLVPGSIMNATLPDAERTKRERAMTEFYNAVTALPPEEREARAIELSEQVIGKVLRDTKSMKLDELRARRAAVLANAAQREKSNEITKAERADIDEEVSQLDARIRQAEQQAK